MHGWGGSPEGEWFQWLKKELESRSFRVTIPQMPDAQHPRIHTWVPALANAVGTADEHTYFVGHSMGCQAIARYLETLPDGIRVGGAIFVGGFFKKLTGDRVRPHIVETDRHWLDTKLDFIKVRTHLPKSIAIFSDNDRVVPLENQDDFRDQLGSEIIVEHAKGHFTGSDDGITELPVLLESLLKIAS